MIVIITDIKTGEPDILAGWENAGLVIRDLDGIQLHSCAAPETGWTTGTLQAIAEQYNEGDAYLESLTGQLWIGSSEI